MRSDASLRAASQGFALRRRAPPRPLHRVGGKPEPPSPVFPVTFSISITDSPGNGLYIWELRDQGLVAGGQAPTVDRCITEIARARLFIEHHVQRHHAHTPNPTLDSHPSPDPSPIRQAHPPSRDPGAPEQDIPSPELGHTPAPITYDHPPTRFG